MGTEEIIELVLILIFFVIGPMLRRRRSGEAAPPPQPGELPLPGGGSAPSRPTVPDYSEYLVRTLEDLDADAQIVIARVEQNPLYADAELAPIAEQLGHAARDYAEETRAIADQGLQDERPAAFRAVELSRLIEEARRPLFHAKASADLLARLADQRTNRGLVLVLQELDRLLAGLAVSGGAPRRVHAVIWDGDPQLVGALMGPGPSGLAPLPSAELQRAAGWAQLAAGVGYDLLGAHPDLLDDMCAAAMVGPLEARTPPQPPYFAGPTPDMASGVCAWMPTIASDMMGAHLLGHAYALAVVTLALSRRLQPQAAATINTEAGRYDPMPPLLVRLSVIDEVLSMEGWGQAENALGALAGHIDLPAEARYVLPNRLTRRLRLQPLLDFMQPLVQALHEARYPSVADRRWVDLVSSRLSTVDENRVEQAARQFAAGKVPSFSPIIMLAGAVTAEYDALAERKRYVDQLLRALRQGPIRHARQRARPTMAIGDRALVRDALVLSEIL